MAVVKEKSGKVLMSELSHVMGFVSAMGYDEKELTVAQCHTLKSAFLNAMSETLGEPTKDVKDAF